MRSFDFQIAEWCVKSFRILTKCVHQRWHSDGVSTKGHDRNRWHLTILQKQSSSDEQNWEWIWKLSTYVCWDDAQHESKFHRMVAVEGEGAMAHLSSHHIRKWIVCAHFVNSSVNTENGVRNAWQKCRFADWFFFEIRIDFLFVDDFALTRWILKRINCPHFRSAGSLGSVRFRILFILLGNWLRGDLSDWWAICIVAAITHRRHSFQWGKRKIETAVGVACNEFIIRRWLRFKIDGKRQLRTVNFNSGPQIWSYGRFQIKHIVV